MSSVSVTFTYEPEDPDETDSTGMSEAEFDELMDQLSQLGATDVRVTKGDS